MSIISVYDIGTVSVAAGGTVVTGVGTGWTGAALREGDMFWCAGLSVRILSATNTQITLAHPWPGTARTNARYEIHYTPDIERAFTTSVTLLDRLRDTGLVSFTEMDKAANEIPIFTGVDTMDTLLTNATGRALLNQILFAITGTNIVTATTTRITGGAVQDSATDTTATKLMRPGAFGLGGLAPRINDIDRVDNTIPPGFYEVRAATVGVPAGLEWGMMLHLRRNVAGGEFQLLVCDSGTAAVINQLFFRTRTAAAWTAWKQIST